MGVPATPAGFPAQTYSLRSYSPSIPNACYATVKGFLWMIFASSYHNAQPTQSNIIFPHVKMINTNGQR